MTLNYQKMKDSVVFQLEQWAREGVEVVPIKKSIIDAKPTRKAAPVAKAKPAVNNVPSQTKVTATENKVAHVQSNDSIEAIAKELEGCTRCKLCEQRTHIVIGRGNPKADLMFIGEAPGRDEDAQGKPFVGRAGKLLDKIIHAMGFADDEIYIANIIKCRPPKNRNPEPEEIETCLPFLLRQVQLVQPKVICTLGAFAGLTLLESDKKISQIRGTFHEFNGIPLMPTYHPAFLLRNPSMKRVVWEDVQKISAKLGRKPVQTKGR